MNTFNFPTRRARARMVSGMMREAERRTIQVLNDSGLVVWSGPSRQGKTTTAQWMTDRINDAYSPKDPDAFRAHYYEVGEIPDWSGNEGKKAVRGMYESILGPLDEGQFRRNPSEQLASRLVEGMSIRGIELVFLDEAGLLSPSAIRGIILVRDTAHNEGRRLSIVLIGMDDLPEKLNAVDQVRGRIQEWIFFDEFTMEETLELMSLMHAPYADVTLLDVTVRKQVEWIHEKCAGRPGLIVALMQKVTALCGDGSPVSLELLKTAHLLTVRDRNAAMKRCRTGTD